MDDGNFSRVTVTIFELRILQGLQAFLHSLSSFEVDNSRSVSLNVCVANDIGKIFDKRSSMIFQILPT